jgi:Na+/proline symporter
MGDIMDITPLARIDWGIIIAYCVFVIGVGLYFSRRASGSLTEYFIAGRKLSWWIAGTSIVATSFAADTPLVISGWMRTMGLQRNWFWWSGILAMMLCTFFYARLWRRANILTDVEFTELRYHGKAAAGLRIFHASFRATIQNCLIMGWVMLAGSTIMEVALNLPTLVIFKNLSMQLVEYGVAVNSVIANPDAILIAMNAKLLGVAICVLIALTYCVLSGIWGVVVADFIQFGMAMTGSIALAVIVLQKLGGPRNAIAMAVENLTRGVVNNGTTEMVVAADQLTRFTPPFNLSAGFLATYSFIVFIALQWLGGGQGGGFLAQRLFSCKNERHSMFAMLWYNFAHYILRPWPWIIVGIGSLVLIPKIPAGMNQEYAYPLMIMRYLPAGMKGILVASLLAAFMSTMDTHLNFGASYLVNDLYKRFVKKDASQKHYILVSRLAVLGLAVLAAMFAMYYKSIASAWYYFTEIMAGAGLVVLLRWYWWRINVWSEISSMACSFILANSLHFIPALSGDLMYPVRLTIIVVVSTIVWVVVTFMTRPEPEEHLEKFYQRVRPGGNWGTIAAKHREVHGLHIGMLEVFGFISGVGCLFTSLLGVGWLCMGKYSLGLIMLGVAAVFALFMFSNIGKMDWEGIKYKDLEG